MTTAERPVRIEASLPAEYLIRRPASSCTRLYLLLHGYQQSAEGLWRKLEAGLPPAAAVLSVSAPFPAPFRRRVPPSASTSATAASDSGEATERWMAGYSWYFYNPETDEYLLDMQSSLEFLAGLLKHLGFATTPTTVIGFSQGGYLAPFLAQRSSAIDHVIGMGCEFLDEELAIQGIPKHVRMDALHGARDDRCSPEKARSAQARLRAVGVPGEFVLLPETGHQFDAPARHELRRLVQLDAP